MCHLWSLALLKVHGIATNGVWWRQWNTCGEATTNYGCTASLKKYVNTYHWCLLCKDAYLGNTKTVRLLCIAVVGFFLLFFFQNWALVHSWQIGFFFFFFVGLRNLQWIQQKGLHLLPLTDTHARVRAWIIFGHGCVYSVSVLIIRYLVRVFFFFLCA